MRASGPFLCLLLFLQFSVYAQDNAYKDKVETLDSTLETLYAVISGEKGEKRDWELFRYLFKPEAQLIPAGKDKDDKVNTFPMTPDGYVERAGKRLEETGFFEKEISRKTETFGNITHVFSTYESFRSASDKEPFARGINSIQLLNDGKRWWIVNIYWMAENEQFPLPKKYLK
jgi:hypothetical protein